MAFPLKYAGDERLAPAGGKTCRRYASGCSAVARFESLTTLAGACEHHNRCRYASKRLLARERLRRRRRLRSIGGGTPHPQMMGAYKFELVAEYATIFRRLASP